MPLPPLAHAGHWAVGLIYLAPVAILVVTLLIIGRRDRIAEAQELRQENEKEGDT